MKKFFVLIIISFVVLSRGVAFADKFIKHPPVETIVLKLPSQEYAHWKEAYREVSENSGVVDRIPSNPRAQNASDVIRISFSGSGGSDSKEVFSIETILEHLRAMGPRDLEGKTIKLNIIEKNQKDLICEWHQSAPISSPSMLAPHKEVLHQTELSPHHQIVRFFVTDNGFHSIEIIRWNGKMSDEERGKWVKTLKESTLVVSYETDVKGSEGFSLTERLKDSLDLGAAFHNWKTTSAELADSGYTLICRIPPSNPENFITECLEVTTMPNLKDVSLEEFFEREKMMYGHNRPEKIEFRVLKKSSSEVIYSFVCRNDLLQSTAVVRSFISGQGYYSIYYRKSLLKEMTPAEIAHVQRRLEAVKVRTGSDQ